MYSNMEMEFIYRMLNSGCDDDIELAIGLLDGNPIDREGLNNWWKHKIGTWWYNSRQSNKYHYVNKAGKIIYINVL